MRKLFFFFKFISMFVRALQSPRTKPNGTPRLIINRANRTTHLCVLETSRTLQKLCSHDQSIDAAIKI